MSPRYDQYSALLHSRSHTPYRFLTILLLAVVTMPVPSMKAQTFQVIHTFQGRDGALPNAVSVDSNGNLFGTTNYGGANACLLGCGTVFKIDSAGNESVLHSFQGQADGNSPQYGVALDSAGNVYGVTPYGGGVFKVDPAGNFSVLYTFQGGSDGSEPNGPVVFDAAGNLYGNTYYGGITSSQPFGAGTVYKIDANGNYSVLYRFDGVTQAFPSGALLPIQNGDLIGTANSGPFSLAPDGTETVLLSSVGGQPVPYNGVIQDSLSGNFFGIAIGQPVPGAPGGQILEMPRQGGFAKVLYTFTPLGPDGSSPVSPLVEDASGRFYGTTREGGLANGGGVVFQVDQFGNYTVVYRFTGGADGAAPRGQLAIDAHGDLYGVAETGGSTSCFYPAGCGTVFKITLPRITIGGSPQQPLTRDAHGNFVALVTVTNNGNLSIDSLRVALAGTTLGSGSLLSVPPPVTRLAPGASAIVALTFPSTAVRAGATTAPLKVNGSYSATSVLLKGGNWGLSFRSVSLK